MCRNGTILTVLRGPLNSATLQRIFQIGKDGWTAFLVSLCYFIESLDVFAKPVMIVCIHD